MIGIGMEVYFRSSVFESSYSEFYEEYKGHKFKVVGYLIDEGEVIDDHVFLECITDSSIQVKGCVHTFDLKRA